MDALKVSAAVLLILLMISVPVLAVEHESTEHEDENDIMETEQEQTNEDGSEREIEVRQETDRVEIESSFETEKNGTETENEFEVEFSVQMEPRIELERSVETETNEQETENEADIEVRFETLLEFVDENDNGVYDDGEEISTYDLNDKEYTLDYTTQSTVHTITARSIDGVFTVRLHAVGDFTNIQGTKVAPTELKIDLEMHDYPFTREDSMLALETDVSTETEGDLSRSGSTIRNPTENMFFSWQEQAVVDGETTTVGASYTPDTDEVEEDPDEAGETEVEHTLHFAYDRGSEIVHDPKIGLKTGYGGLMGFLQSIIDFFLNLF